MSIVMTTLQLSSSALQPSLPLSAFLITISQVNVMSSFAVPFEEDERDPNVWFVDHNYIDDFYRLCRKVNARERIVGWYSTGPKIKVTDIAINELFKRFVPDPAFVIVEVNSPDDVDIPTKAYASVEVLKDDGSPKISEFMHLQCEIGAAEAEEIGVEHLLRDVKDVNITSLSQQVTEKIFSLRALQLRLVEAHEYLKDVIAHKLPINHEITQLLQDVFNLLPNLDIDAIIRAFTLQTNDMMLVVYVTSVVRSVLALHALINNKVSLREAEAKAEEEQRAKEDEKKAEAAGGGKKKEEEEQKSKK